MKLKKIKELFKLSFYAKCKYIKYYKKLKIKDNYILLDSQHGKNINGNIYYILKELITNKKYNNYKIFLTSEKKYKNELISLLKKRNIYNCEIVVNNTFKYYKIMASAKYLINDTSFSYFFMKKDGQKYLNVWHGTPFKTMGKSINESFESLGNIQKNFILSDYLLYPSEFMMNNMIKDYMLENICHSKCILTGYPRNEIFFNKSIRNEIRKKYNLKDKQIIAYMPTWRGTENEIDITCEILKNIDDKLTDNQVLYVNLHPFVNNSIEFNFSHIKKFPKEYEVYEFLAATDCLITDYSSVFFDYANTKNKIILFNYDKEDYLKTRGLYLSFDELPFPCVDNIDKLIEEINKPNINYDKFINKYCKYENKNASKLLCEYFILNKKTNFKELNIKSNNKKNILIYGGNFIKNGITTALLNLLNNLPNKYNYYITFNTKSIKKNKNILKTLPNTINYIPMNGGFNLSLTQIIMLKLFLKGMLPKFLDNKIHEIYRYEIKRLFSDVNYSNVIQYTGYNKKEIMMFSLFDCNKIIYAHSDIKAEIKNKNHFKKNFISKVYNNYDKIIVVNDFIIDNIKDLVEDPSKIHFVNNIVDYNTIINKSKQDIAFDDNTVSNMEFEKIKNILNSKSTKFLTIGRFSKEKGHFRLVDAFSKYNQENKNSYLIIIGGYGVLYDDLIQYVKDKKNIIVIKSLSNPYPFIKKCDCFVLSSFYEGLPVVITEADVLKKPVLSTNIDGVRRFLSDYNGNMVDNNEDGIYNGMNLYKKGNLKLLTIDYDKYNEKAMKDFLKLLK